MKLKFLVLGLFLVILLSLPTLAFSQDKLTAFKDTDPETLRTIVITLVGEYESKGQIDEAIALYKEALTILVDDQDLLVRLGTLYSSQSNHIEAIAVYEKLQVLNPASLRYASLLSNSYRKIGDINKGVKLWEDMMSGSQDPEVFMQAANFMGESQDTLKKAVRAAEKALAISPDNETYKKNMEYFKGKAASAGIDLTEKKKEVVAKQEEVREEEKKPEEKKKKRRGWWFGR